MYASSAAPIYPPCEGLIDHTILDRYWTPHAGHVHATSGFSFPSWSGSRRRVMWRSLRGAPQAVQFILRYSGSVVMLPSGLSLSRRFFKFHLGLQLARDTRKPFGDFLRQSGDGCNPCPSDCINVLARKRLAAIFLGNKISQQTPLALLPPQGLSQQARKLLTKDIRETVSTNIVGFVSENSGYFTFRGDRHGDLLEPWLARRVLAPDLIGDPVDHSHTRDIRLRPRLRKASG